MVHQTLPKSYQRLFGFLAYPQNIGIQCVLQFARTKDSSASQAHPENPCTDSNAGVIQRRIQGSLSRRLGQNYPPTLVHPHSTSLSLVSYVFDNRILVGSLCLCTNLRGVKCAEVSKPFLTYSILCNATLMYVGLAVCACLHAPGDASRARRGDAQRLASGSTPPCCQCPIPHFRPSQRSLPPLSKAPLRPGPQPRTCTFRTCNPMPVVQSPEQGRASRNY